MYGPPETLAAAHSLQRLTLLGRCSCSDRKDWRLLLQAVAQAPALRRLELRPLVHSVRGFEPPRPPQAVLRGLKTLQRRRPGISVDASDDRLCSFEPPGMSWWDDFFFAPDDT